MKVLEDLCAEYTKIILLALIKDIRGGQDKSDIISLMSRSAASIIASNLTQDKDLWKTYYYNCYPIIEKELHKFLSDLKEIKNE